MDRSIFNEMAVVQADHWWFVGRRRILRSIITSLRLAPNAHILEIGSGTGANLKMLSEFGRVSACETDDQARAMCAAEGWMVTGGYLPDELSQIEGSFDLICLIDVLEHVKDDTKSIAVLKDKLKPGGRLLVSCPAYGWLFSEYDRALGHYRRYTDRALSKLMMKCGLEVEKKGYFNTILFPMIAAGRAAEFFGTNTRKDAIAIPPRIVNRALCWIFSLEAQLTGFSLFPFGSSTVVCGKLPSLSR